METARTTMIEKIARAICAEDPFASTKGPLPWDDVSKHGKDRLRKNARAALTAILEPSETMVRAGTDQLELDSDGGLLGGTKEAVDRAFVAMIQAALNEKDA